METSKDSDDSDAYLWVPSDCEPVLQEDWENMSGDYYKVSSTDTFQVSDLITASANSIDWDAIQINTADINTYMEGDLIFQPKDEEPVHVLKTLREQQLQIEALTDMIGEMVKTKNFDIDWDLEKRVEQKRFLNKLGGK